MFTVGLGVAEIKLAPFSLNPEPYGSRALVIKNEATQSVYKDFV
jgi:hypothetical protein